MLYYDDYGYGDISDIIEVQASGYTASATTSSYAGGKLTVSGSSISEQATITVGGMTGKVIEVRSSEADFEIPPLITTDVIDTFPELEKV